MSDAPPDDLSGRWPSGGYLAATDDLARLGAAIVKAGFLRAASLETMLTSQRLASGQATKVGIGWRIAADSTGRTYLHHGGTSNGGSAFLLVIPDERIVVAAAANALGQFREAQALAVAAIFRRRD